jgi:hypothetical protein
LSLTSDLIQLINKINNNYFKKTYLEILTAETLRKANEEKRKVIESRV